MAGVHFILCSQRTQCFHPTAFTALGLDPTTLRSIVVKSTNHFRAGFDAIATDTVYVDSPGAIRSDFATIPYKRFTAPYWPKVDDPWAWTPSPPETPNEGDRRKRRVRVLAISADRSIAARGRPRGVGGLAAQPASAKPARR